MHARTLFCFSLNLATVGCFTPGGIDRAEPGLETGGPADTASTGAATQTGGEDSATTTMPGGETTSRGESSGVPQTGDDSDSSDDGEASSGGSESSGGAVPIREVLATPAVVAGNLGGVAGADALCPVGYAAMLVDGVTRVASISPNAGDGQVDWVLQPDTQYVNEAGELLWETDASALLAVAGGAAEVLGAQIAPTNDGALAWTGMAADWTTASHCNAWSQGAGAQGLTGNPTATSDGAFVSALNYGCQVPAHLYCVEQ